MKYQIIISTKNGDAKKICQESRINSNALIINQTEKTEYSCFSFQGYDIEEYSFNQKGLGLSREMGLNLSAAEIILFSDDDMVYCNDYAKKMIQEFELHPEADAILFNVKVVNSSRGDDRRRNRKANVFHRITLREATYRMINGGAVRSEKVKYNNIHFSALLGTGGKYSSGEDTLFLCDMIRAGMKVYYSPVEIATTDWGESTWYQGRDDDYYIMRGSIIAAVFPKWCYLLAIIKAAKNRRDSSFFNVYRCYLRGIKEYLNHK